MRSTSGATNGAILVGLAAGLLSLHGCGSDSGRGNASGSGGSAGSGGAGGSSGGATAGTGGTGTGGAPKDGGGSDASSGDGDASSSTRRHGKSMGCGMVAGTAGTQALSIPKCTGCTAAMGNCPRD